jgi:hypothetical protein
VIKADAGKLKGGGLWNIRKRMSVVAEQEKLTSQTIETCLARGHRPRIAQDLRGKVSITDLEGTPV